MIWTVTLMKFVNYIYYIILSCQNYKNNNV